MNQKKNSLFISDTFVLTSIAISTDSNSLLVGNVANLGISANSSGCVVFGELNTGNGSTKNILYVSSFYQIKKIGGFTITITEVLCKWIIAFTPYPLSLRHETRVKKIFRLEFSFVIRNKDPPYIY